MKRLILAAVLALACLPALAQDGAEPFVGRWALDLPGNAAGWLEVKQQDGWLDGSVLWGGGSVLPLDSVYLEDGTLRAARGNTVERKLPDGAVRSQFVSDLYAFTVQGDTISGTRVSPRSDGTGVASVKVTGKRIPPLPPAPDLAKLKFGEPVTLFNGKNLDGWKPLGLGKNGWRAENGVLVNDARQEEGKPKVHYANLRTEAEFEDFNLTLEVSVPKDGNSGIYLRGVYEVQVLDSFGKPLDTHNMGGIYSRVAPAAAAEKPAGEWQTMDITLVDRHVTVILNGVKILDNIPLAGCTGGALWADEFRPGPLYLQGDHTAVQYRNLILRPVIK